MTVAAKAAAPSPDHCHPLSVGHSLRVTNRGSREALKTRAAKVPGTAGPIPRVGAWPIWPKMVAWPIGHSTITRRNVMCRSTAGVESAAG